MSAAKSTTFEAREPLHLLDAAGALARVQSGTKTFAVDLRTGAATAGEDLPARAPQRRQAVATASALARPNWRRAIELGIGADAVPIRVPIEVAGIVVSEREERSENGEVFTTITSNAASITVPGEAIDVVSSDGSLVVARTHRGVFVVDLQRSHVLASFGYAREDILLAAHDDVAVIATRWERGATCSALHVVRRSGEWLRVPFPKDPEAAAVTDGFVVLLAQNQLFAIDRATLVGPPSSGAPLDTTLEIAPRADARGDDGACVVRSVLQKFVSLTELRTDRRFNVTMSDARSAQRFSKGDRVYLVDGNLTKEAELPASFGLPASVVQEASTLPELLPVASPPRRRARAPRDHAAIDGLRRAIDFAPSPLFERFLALDEDWSWPFGAFAPNLEKADVGVVVDPCLITLFDSGDGNYVGTYDYPPARAEGSPFVRFDHEESALVWLGQTFDDALAEALRDESATALARLRKLGLPVTFLDDHPAVPPPAWFDRAHPRASRHDAAHTLSEADRLRSEGDLLGAERLYVRAIHRNITRDPSLEARTTGALAEIYRELGWAFQAHRI